MRGQAVPGHKGTCPSGTKGQDNPLPIRGCPPSVSPELPKNEEERASSPTGESLAVEQVGTCGRWTYRVVITATSSRPSRRRACPTAHDGSSDQRERSQNNLWTSRAYEGPARNPFPPAGLLGNQSFHTIWNDRNNCTDDVRWTARGLRRRRGADFGNRRARRPSGRSRSNTGTVRGQRVCKWLRTRTLPPAHRMRNPLCLSGRRRPMPSPSNRLARSDVRRTETRRVASSAAIGRRSSSASARRCSGRPTTRRGARCARPSFGTPAIPKTVRRGRCRSRRRAARKRS